MGKPDDGTTPVEDRAPVDDVVQRIRAGMDSRRAALAALDETPRDTRLLDLEIAQHVEEPAEVPRPVIGPLIFFARKLYYRLFLKWYMKQQARFNQVAGRRIEELVEQNRQLRQRLDEVERRLDGDRH